MSRMREKAAQGIQAGDVFSVTRTFSQEETEAFGHLTKDYNPVHYDEEFAGIKGFPQLILHGLLTAGMVCEVGGQLAWLATAMEFRFRRPVFFGDTITCTVTVTSVDQRGWAKAEALYTNQRGEVVVSAQMEGQVPMDESQEVLSRRLDQGDPYNPLN
ncbi:MAG: MaoC family dehydratase [Proteobacteria bacterium]|nr:MaoC family dehydratase [Pseudomonadota bacterium]MBU4276923.1 MaoC family dehydratase [Pseudomonadota bacterium]MBU4383242.1 MaoC family dehydratase [Pseudomonadota bacterium]MBU4603770.1 MaoC family dehydratase [Pseudomonadota bacterium]MCG2764281.1 MaoC family dehydratase [Desulfarculaceae bacterium]